MAPLFRDSASAATRFLWNLRPGALTPPLFEEGQDVVRDDEREAAAHSAVAFTTTTRGGRCGTVMAFVAIAIAIGK